MASSQVGASPAPSRKEMLEAGKRKLLEFRKQKAEERAKKASASSTEDSQSSRIKNSHAVQQSAGNLPTNTEELNGTSFEKNPNKDPGNHVFQPSHTTTSAVPYSVAPSNKGQAPEVFVVNHANAKSSAGEDIQTRSTTLSIAPDTIYGGNLQRPSFKDNDESDRRNIFSSNEFDSGNMNNWRRSSLENSSELPRHQEAKTVSDELPNAFLQSANIYSNRAEQESMKDEFFLSQEKNFKDIQLGKWNGRENEFKERMPVEQVSSSFFSKDAEENLQYREKMQPMTHPSLLHLADDPGMNQMDRHTGSSHINSNLLKPEFIAKKFSDEHRAFGNGKYRKEETTISREGSKYSSSDRSNNRQSQNQDSFGAQLYSDTKNHTGLFSTVNSWRSRPSFLDSVASSASSATTQTDFDASETLKSTGELLHTEAKNIAEPSAMRPWQSMNNEKEDSKKLGLQDRVLNHLEFSSSQKNDDFGALEQHIEDLTQEKFALQRALDASRTLTESLAQENSSLTEAFNQQGAAVSQLKSDLERQQEEINAQVLVLNTLKMEFDNAQLECSAADERAKMLASEVISLEEKALRLRSNELKLERQLETVNDEVASNRRHISSLEKERLDLQSTIDALQEEKKLLQSKLRKVAANGSFDLPASTKPSKNVKEASTSTEDIGIEYFNFPGGNGLFWGRQDGVTAITPMSQSLLSTADVHQALDSQSGGIVSSRNLSLSSFTNTASSSNSSQRHHMLDLPVAIPSDQQRMVDNINSLIEELALEKESLARALKTESSEVTKLKASNQELSQKLESQTQRLELLISQNMAHGSSALGPRNIVNMQDELEYVDEGDEVVERVLGWIMKLFPGGSSKRRISKLL